MNNVDIVDKKAYSDVLAPIYCLNDFSTEFLNRKTGDKLTGSKMQDVSSTKMIEMILQKAGVIELTRLLRILHDGC